MLGGAHSSRPVRCASRAAWRAPCPCSPLRSCGLRIAHSHSRRIRASTQWTTFVMASGWRRRRTTAPWRSTTSCPRSAPRTTLKLASSFVPPLTLHRLFSKFDCRRSGASCVTFTHHSTAILFAPNPTVNKFDSAHSPSLFVLPHQASFDPLLLPSQWPDLACLPRPHRCVRLGLPFSSLVSPAPLGSTPSPCRRRAMRSSRLRSTPPSASGTRARKTARSSPRCSSF